MKNVLIPVGLVTSVFAGWVVYAGLFAQAHAAQRIELVPVSHPAYDPTKIEREIRFHEERVRRDPGGAIGWAMLSGAHLAKSREQDDDASSWKAEEAARRSLKIQRRGNIRAAIQLTNSLLEQHRFQDALKAADEAMVICPDDQAKLLRADILIEIGRLDDAGMQLRSVRLQDPSFLAVQARWQSAKGEREKSLATWRKAIGDLEGMGHVGEELIAWFQVKAGSELLQLDRAVEAEKMFANALLRAPKSYKACLGLAEAALARKEYKQAVEWSDQTLGMVNSFRAMAIRGEALAAMGRGQEAIAQFRAMHAAFLDEDKRYAELGKGGPLGVRHPDREFATFCASRGMFVEDGLRAARRDLLNRPDELAKANLQKLLVMAE